MGKKAKIALGIAGALVLAIGGWVGYVEATCKRDFSAIPLPDIKASKDPKVIAHGAYVARAIAHCSACHGNGESTNKHELPKDPNDLRGGYVLAAGPFGTYYPANLTPDPETGIANMTDAQMARVIRHGVGPTGGYDPLMAFAVGPMADEDLTAVVSYLRSIPPIKNQVKKDEWGFMAKALSGKFNPRMTTAPKYVAPVEGEVRVERGEYIANGPGLCFGCHTKVDPMKGFAEIGPRFAGSDPEPDHEDGAYEICAPNLTPDPETGVLASHTEESFLDRFRKVGMTHKGSPMPWDNFKQMTDEDLKSVFKYLRSLPPVKNPTGPTHRKKGWKPT